MAAVDFPWNLVRVEFAGYGQDSPPGVRRTELEDGAVRQAITVARVMEGRTFSALVKLSNYDELSRWVRTNKNTEFNFKDFEDGLVKNARLRGGLAGYTRESAPGVRVDSERCMRVSFELEGFWDDVV